MTFDHTTLADVTAYIIRVRLANGMILDAFNVHSRSYFNRFHKPLEILAFSGFFLKPLTTALSQILRPGRGIHAFSGYLRRWLETSPLWGLVYLTSWEVIKDAASGTSADWHFRS